MLDIENIIIDLKACGFNVYEEDEGIQCETSKVRLFIDIEGIITSLCFKLYLQNSRKASVICLDESHIKELTIEEVKYIANCLKLLDHNKEYKIIEVDDFDIEF